MPDELQQLAELVHRESGIALRPNQHRALRGALRRAAPDVEPASFVRLAADPVRGPAAVARLVDEITIRETSFFREPAQLGGVDWNVLLEAARAAGSPRIRGWSAACATGEEAYTLAILACEAFDSPEPPVRILATDISARALAQAAEGRYRARSLANVEREVRERYFSRDGDTFVVDERVRRLVAFARHNLVRDPVPPPGHAHFELVACRNVLIYFDGETVERVGRALEGAVVPRGVLVIGVADAGALAVAGRSLPRARRSRARERRPASDADRPSGALRGRDATAEEPIAQALAAADAGRVDEAVAKTKQILEANPFDADAYFVRGLAESAAGNPVAAVPSLRRALYIDPDFGLAAFQLARAYEALGDTAAAERSYEQALRALEQQTPKNDRILSEIDVRDVAAACRARLASAR